MIDDADLFDEAVHGRLLAAAGRVPVDVDDEWQRLVDRIDLEEGEAARLGAVTRPPHALRPGLRLLGIAAAVVVGLLLLGRPVVRVTVTAARFVQEVVQGEQEAPAAPAPSSTTTPTTAVPTTLPPPTLPPPPPTTLPPPPPTTTTTAPPATTTTVDAAHGELRGGTSYERSIRQVHIQLNDAIGFNRSNYAALEGAPELVESLLGQRPEFDARLRDTIGHLRQAMRAQDRNAASQAHTIIYEIEQQLGTAGKR